MKRKNSWVIAILVLLLFWPLAISQAPRHPGWEDFTPSRNYYLSNNYRLYPSVTEDVGIAIHTKDYPPDAPGSIKIYVQNINEYGFYDGVIIGKAKKGFFLFNEGNKTVVYFSNKQQLCAKVKQQGLKSLDLYSNNYYYLFLTLTILLIYIKIAERKNWLSQKWFSNKTIKLLKEIILFEIFILNILFVFYFLGIVFLNMSNFGC